MKISQLLQVVLVSSFVAVPAMAASPSVGTDQPISLCGEKAEKAEKGDSTATTEKKSDKKNEKKESKEDKAGTKGSA
jgi:hypothetical protein